MVRKEHLAEIVRVWRALPHGKRQTEDQAAVFANEQAQRYGYFDYQDILAGLKKYVGLPE